MKKFRSIFAILLALVLCFALVACNKAKDEPATTGDQPASTGGAPDDNSGDANILDRVHILLEAPIQALDPMNVAAAGNGCRVVYRCVMDRLVVNSPEGEYVPELATRWDVSDDKLTYTFYLRDDVYFHNGQKFTAQDVIDTVALAKEAVGSTPYSAYGAIDTITAIDEYTVQCVLGAVNMDFLFNITAPNCSIVNKAAIDADPVAGKWVGTGAYKVTDFISSNSVTLTRNDDYWGKKGTTKELYFQFVPEPAARLIMLENGETHMVSGGIGVEYMPRVEDHPDKYTLVDIISDLGFTATFNMNNPVTADKNLRAAIIYCWNVDQIAWIGAEKWAHVPTSGAYWGHTTPYENTDLPIRGQDIDLAKQYLADSNYDGSAIQIMSATEGSIVMAELMAEEMKAIGINVELFNTDLTSVYSYDTPGGTTTQIVNNLAVFSGAASSVKSGYYSTGGGNAGKFSNAEVDRILDEAPAVTDEAQRAAMYKQIQQIYYDEFAGINFYHRSMPLIFTVDLKGVIVHPEMHHDFRYMYVEK